MNLLKYEEMSDFEINQEVARHKYDVFAACHDGSRVNGSVSVNGVDFDPCNNPSDAWPIIVENKISLTTEDGSDDWHADVVIYIDENGKGVIMDVKDECHTYGSNPLRAAMICFLKMKDAEVSE
ncbi:TPA: phage protein NinX family protein [Vibrio parahaemolyticus]